MDVTHTAPSTHPVADSAPPPAPAIATTPSPNPMGPPLRRPVFAPPQTLTAAGNLGQAVPVTGKQPARGWKPSAGDAGKRQQAAAPGDEPKKLKVASVREPWPIAVPEVAAVEEVLSRHHRRCPRKKRTCPRLRHRPYPTCLTKCRKAKSFARDWGGAREGRERSVRGSPPSNDDCR